jgi:hypothetical protein
MRVSVSSWKSNSDRDFKPVFRPIWSLITSSSVAGRAPVSGSTTMTSLMILLIFASVSGAAPSDCPTTQVSRSEATSLSITMRGGFVTTRAASVPCL